MNSWYVRVNVRVHKRWDTEIIHRLNELLRLARSCQVGEPRVSMLQMTQPLLPVNSWTLLDCSNHNSQHICLH